MKWLKHEKTLISACCMLWSSSFLPLNAKLKCTNFFFLLVYRKKKKKALHWHSPTLLGLAPFYQCFFFFVPIPFYFLFFLLQIFYFSTSVCDFVCRVCICLLILCCHFVWPLSLNVYIFFFNFQ